jgi:hypothetical protein
MVVHDWSLHHIQINSKNNEERVLLGGFSNW